MVSKVLLLFLLFCAEIKSRTQGRNLEAGPEAEAEEEHWPRQKRDSAF